MHVNNTTINKLRSYFSKRSLPGNGKQSASHSFDFPKLLSQISANSHSPFLNSSSEDPRPTFVACTSIPLITKVGSSEGVALSAVDVCRRLFWLRCLRADDDCAPLFAAEETFL